MKAVHPWPASTECSLEGFAEFKKELMRASYHNAADNSNEWSHAKQHVIAAAEVAIIQDWPYWAMQRMFKECNPMVAWDDFMQKYINCLKTTS